MFFRCQRSVMAVIIEVLLLYKEGDDHGNMYSGTGMPPNCSSTRPPLSSNCTPCTSGEDVFTVCRNVTENSKLVMEGDGRTIDLFDSECPRMLATIKNPDFLAEDAVLLNSNSAAAPAETLPSLTCCVSRQNGGFIYRLSRPPRSSKCDTSWELKDRTVIARDSEFHESVQSLTNQLLTMKDFQPDVHYISDCDGLGGSHLQNRILDHKDNPITTVNSTLICITESCYLTKPIFYIPVTLIVIGVVVVVALLIWRKCRRGGSATPSVAYTPANGKNEMELEEIKEVIIKTCNRS
ncbi:uncharacterized protein LOC130194357 isoform X2 [Pseudoliparis swirei]|uniref:uncharacterized protein LOC130194357 isoform X2 n=1 Tax=Pseudoliparis swirei TaxID=2059687 RepID=UPI0024BE0217|nr:uncharacterized protein LOC130194357 isoform X2 [Pseudoliparis swirei]